MSGKEEGAAGMEVAVFEGMSSGDVASPVIGGARRKVKRVRSLSEGSPEQEGGVQLDITVRAKECTKKVGDAIKELNTYVGKWFSKEKHEAFFANRFTRILVAQGELVTEFVRMSRMLDRILAVEKKVKDVTINEEGEFDRRFKELENRLMDGVRQENRMSMEKMCKEVERSRKLLEEEDAQRQGDVERLENVVKVQKKELEKWMAQEIGKVRQETARMEEFMKRMVEEQNVIGKSCRSVEGHIKGTEERVEDVRSVLLQCREEGKIDVAAGGVEVNQLVKGMDEVRKKVDELVVEGVRVRGGDQVEAMDVEGSEKMGWSEVVKKGKKKRGPMVVIESSEKVGRREAREELIKCLDPKEGEIRVKSFRRQGRDFVLEVHDEGDLVKLRGLPKIEEAGFRVDGEPNLLSPRVVIHDIDSELTEGDIVRSVWKKNGRLLGEVQEEDFGKVFKPKHKTGKRGRNTVSWVAQVEPDIFGRLVREGRLYIGLRCCRVREFVGVTRCFKCQGLGHIGRLCGRPVTCARCGDEGHHATRCTKVMDGLECANCKRMGFREVGHSVMWSGCPCVDIFRNRVIAPTRYD
ncbi:uncharacterized protein [Rhodnius prolixus]|uniref:uncharacterized protein n=1 Tax=Rhodnius prolixus TaxID=13249 RepID=UPI003D18967C